MKNIKSITLFLVFSIYAFTSSYSQSTIHINEGDRIQIGKNISYFVDTTRNLGINDIQDKTFIPCDSDILNLGNIPDNVWMRFTVNSETEKEIFLEISASLLNELEVYEIVGASSKHLFSGSSNKKTLLKLHFISRDIVYILFKFQSYYLLRKNWLSTISCVTCFGVYTLE